MQHLQYSNHVNVRPDTISLIKFTIYFRSGGRVDKPGRGRGASRGGRGGRGGGRGRGKKEPAPSAEELDKELDTYLKAR